ncbi:hypothetical protein P9B03_02035 [Metasolibacillus meyeri]|uniref:Uncharacterized protein n=1 Tax=Metasolibacillus meyeri TaxID=1071052 RepID=A0AAW9NS57_9BACL|nr:hypothetical protein [Metasolibacillus meyeri]MEC1177250.1 hypothetical protein [Metasolibacillus meyeri]
MKNTVFAFIKELEKECVTLQVNSQEVKVALIEENRNFIFEAIEQGTYIVPFNLVSGEVAVNISSLQFLY